MFISSCVSFFKDQYHYKWKEISSGIFQMFYKDQSDFFSFKHTFLRLSSDLVFVFVRWLLHRDLSFGASVNKVLK